MISCKLLPRSPLPSSSLSLPTRHYSTPVAASSSNWQEITSFLLPSWWVPAGLTWQRQWKRVQLVDLVQTPCPQSTAFLTLLLLFLKFILGLPWWLRQVKNLPTTQETRFDPWVGKIPWRREWKPTPVFLPAESHGQRIIALQCCINFCCTATWISYMYTYIPSLLDSPHPSAHPIPLSHHRAVGWAPGATQHLLTWGFSYGLLPSSEAQTFSCEQHCSNWKLL